jgi:glycosyltransferase involved in cell wall biosynthesis
MKILIVQDTLRSGGTERQSVLLANAFAADGHATTLLTFRPGGQLVPTLSPAVTTHALQSFDLHCDWFAPGLGRYIEQHPADVILCMGRMANCYGQWLVREVQDRWPDMVVIGTMRTGKKLPWLFRYSLRHVHHIVANSRAARDTLVDEYKLNAAKITVIHNSLVFTQTSNSPATNLRAEHGATNRTLVLLDVAMFRPEKRQHELIEIAAGLPPDLDWQLWLLGDGPELDRCRRLAGKLGVAERVKFPGLIREPSAYYAAANIAVHTSHSESLSNFLIEAQAHGLPAVAYAAQGVEECFLAADTGIALPLGDQTGFRTAIQHFATPDGARSARAREFARATFDPARQVQAYLDLFHRLLHSKS